MKGTAGIFVIVMAMLLSSMAQAQISTNNQVIPLIQMRDVSIRITIENLARQAGINFLLDPRLMQRWINSKEPTVTFRLENVTARDALQRLLPLHHIGLIEDPASNIAFVVPADQVSKNSFPSPAKRIAGASPDTNILPLVSFSDVPITMAIYHLAKQAGLNYLIDPQLCRLWTYYPEPMLTFRMENVTAWNMLNRLLNIRNLILEEGPVSHVARITFSDEPLPDVDASPLNLQTNDTIVPVIELKDVPLDVALESLVRQSGLNAVLDPRLKDYSDPQNPPPHSSVRWTNLTAKQAIVALCENYDLTIVKDNVGTLQIKPREIKRHHHLQLR